MGIEGGLAEVEVKGFRKFTSNLTPEKINLCSLTFTRALPNLYINIVTF